MKTVFPLIFTLVLLAHLGCVSDSEVKRRRPDDKQGASTSRGTAKKKIEGRWCFTTLDLGGFNLDNLSREDRAAIEMVLGGLERTYRGMCIEYFDDRAGERGSYEMVIQSPGALEPTKQFGDYEILAGGKRLKLDENSGGSMEIKLEELSSTQQKWRIQMSDLPITDGEPLPPDMASMVMYFTFRRQGRN